MLEACLPVAPPYLRILHGLSFFPKVIAVWMFSLKLVAKPVFLLPFSKMNLFDVITRLSVVL